jgi:hypothetical protein
VSTKRRSKAGRTGTRSEIKGAASGSESSPARGRRWAWIGGGLLAAGVITVAWLVLAPARRTETTAPTQPPPKPGQIRFENRQAGSGVEFVLDNGTTEDKPIIDSMLGGLALLDYDNDGDLDIFFTNGARIPSLQKDGPSFYNRLYRNEGGGVFRDVTDAAGVAGSGYSMGAAVGDYDNDGYPDLFVAGVNVNSLYHNQRDGTFRDVTAEAGVTGRLPSGKQAWAIGGAWLDFDTDGDLDLFVVNYLDWSPAGNRLCGDPGRRLSCSPVLYEGLPNLLYRNNGDGTFTDVSASTGVNAHVGKGMGMAIADYDDDGDMDVFVGNDTERNFLFRNVDGKHFAEVGVEAAVAFTEDGIPISSMGVDFRDLNNDGLPDVHISALANETFPVFFNSGKGYFTDVTYRSGMGASSFTVSGWGNGIVDFDNDGWKDIFVAGGHVSENIEQYRHEKYRLPNAVWQNLGGVFEKVSDRAGFTSATAAAHRGAAFGDLDGDGRVDVVVSVIGGKAELWMNRSTREHNWITILTEGTASNRDGIGTRIRITGASGLTQYNHVTTCFGYASSSDKRVHFGLGSDTHVREIELRWPNGKRQLLKNVAANQVLRIREQ